MLERFRYHDEIKERFPDIVGGVIYATKLDGAHYSPELSELYCNEQKAALEKFASKPLSEVASIAAWRRAFRAFGVNPTKYRSASEALLRRLTKKDSIPSINLFVDIANLVSIRYALPVAMFDTRQLTLPITVQFSDGTEVFLPIGQSQPESPLFGEVIFKDERQNVVARRWCWRQSASSAATEATTSAVITVEAQNPEGSIDVENALKDLSILVSKFGGGEFESALIHA